jgi:signal transduction histidine kinase/ActR/RegA family two-component response regulator
MPTEPTTATDILLSLGMAVFVPGDGDELIPVGGLPPWWLHVDPEGGRQAPCFRPSSRHIFLAHFLEEARRFFRNRASGVCDSGIWEHEVDEDTRYYLHVRAVRLADGSDFIVIQDLESSGIDLRRVIQHGRDSHMRALKDLAQREQLANELRRAQAVAERLDRLKTELLGKVSHELRTPLTSILGMCELALASTTTGSTQSRLQAIQHSGRYLKRLVDDLLDTAALESGMLALRMIPFEIQGLLSTIDQTFREMADSKGIQFTIDCKVALDSSKPIYGDPDRLRQVLTNLIDNAMRFTSKGEVRLVVEGHPEDEKLVRIMVHDTGAGIPDEEQTAIFDPFVQVAGSAADPLQKTQGTGLGLTIASKLVDGMGGVMRLQSRVGLGSTFTIELPMLDATVPMGERACNASASAGTQLAEYSSGDIPTDRVFKILIVDDNSMNRQFLHQSLLMYGHQVVEATNGLEAIDQVAKHELDLVLMDCRMPQCDGFEATKRIRHAERSSGGYLPIVALTANATTQERERCLSAGMDGYLSKPYTIEQLRMAVRRASERKIAPIRS